MDGEPAGMGTKARVCGCRAGRLGGTTLVQAEGALHERLVTSS